MTGRRDVLGAAFLVAALATGCTTRRPAALPAPGGPALAQIPILLIPRSPDPEIVRLRATPCLGSAEARRLRAARPRPLRGQRMPPTPAERVARTAAQLGLYEATGAWADQVEAALRKCD